MVQKIQRIRCENRLHAMRIGLLIVRDVRSRNCSIHSTESLLLCDRIKMHRNDQINEAKIGKPIQNDRHGSSKIVFL